MTVPPPVTGPEQLMQMYMSMAPGRSLAAAVQLDVFSHLGAGPADAAGLARAIGASERGTRMLLDVLCAFGLAAKQSGRYVATEPARRYLTRSSAEYMGAFMETDAPWEAWGSLTETIRTGRPRRQTNEAAQAETFFPALVRSLHVLNTEPARRAAAALGAERAQGLQVIDIACGSGVWGIAIAEADPAARVTAQDFPGMLGLTRTYAERHGVADRFEYLPGDMKSVPLPAGAYDLALLGNIIHGESGASARALLRRLHQALRPSGRVAIIDVIPNDERTGPPFPLLFALNMLVHTEEGDTYTAAEYGAWLDEAGFTAVETVDIGSHSPMIVATRR